MASHQTASSHQPPPWIRLHEEVQRALAEGRPVVALETTVVTHGLPRPANLEIARKMEAEVRAGGAIPATIGLLDGQVHVGLTANTIERLATESDLHKISVRDIGAAVAKGWSGGTTVAATMAAARRVGIQVFSTGGIGGVHRGPTGDVSADLTELARTRVAVVCSGAKSILDLPRTVEWLETAGVPVVGWGTDEFPAFFSRSSGLPVSVRVESEKEGAALIRAHWGLETSGGVLVCVPCPADAEVPAVEIDAAVRQAEMGAGSIRGQEVTPYLLGRMVELTGGASLRANLALLRQNARVGGELAAAMAGMPPD